MILGSRPPLPPVIHRVGALLILYRYIGICDRHRRKVPSIPYSWCSSFVARGLSGVLFVSFTHCSDPSDHLTSGPRRVSFRSSGMVYSWSFLHSLIWSFGHVVLPVTLFPRSLLIWPCCFGFSFWFVVDRRSLFFFQHSLREKGCMFHPARFFSHVVIHTRSFLLPLTESKCAPGD